MPEEEEGMHEQPPPESPMSKPVPRLVFPKLVPLLISKSPTAREEVLIIVIKESRHQPNKQSVLPPRP
jgi:hypothetical protein